MGNLLCGLTGERLCKRDAPFPAPSQDPFYEVPDEIASYDNGQLLATRSVPTPLAFGPLCKEVVQLKYKYTAAFDVDDSTLVTFIKPRIHSEHNGKLKVVVLALAEDSVALLYSPSFAISNPSASPMGPKFLPDLTVWTALEKGWYVAIPDQEGSKSAWSSRDTEGHATLDAMRAVISYQGMPASKFDFVLQGYSGGSRSACAAAELASVYAPELVPSIKACVAGGLVADLQAVARHLEGTEGAGLAIAGAMGLANIRPDLAKFFDEKLNDKGRAIFAQLRSGELGEPNYDKLAGLTLSELTTVSDVFADPVFVNSYGSELLGSPDLPPVQQFPFYLIHAENDPIVPLEQAEACAERLAKRGTNVTLITPKVPSPISGGSAHLLTSFLAHPSFVCAMNAAFDHPGDGCPASILQQGYQKSDTLPVAETSGLKVARIIGISAYVVLQEKLKHFQLGAPDEAGRREAKSAGAMRFGGHRVEHGLAWARRKEWDGLRKQMSGKGGK